MGQRINAWTSFESRLRYSKIGIPKANVFPVPVGAFAITLILSIKRGMAFCWIVVGLLTPIFLSESITSGDRSRSANVISSLIIPLISIYPANYITDILIMVLLLK